jgi:hypothetical protein
MGKSWRKDSDNNHYDRRSDNRKRFTKFKNSNSQNSYNSYDDEDDDFDCNVDMNLSHNIKGN